MDHPGMESWPTGIVERPEPLVRRLLAANPSPFTYTGTQTYIVGSGEVAVIDPGPDLPEHLDALMRAIEGEQVTAIVCTHTHRDHSPASRPLAAATGAPIVGCAPLALEDAGPRADAAFDADYAPGRVLADGDTVTGHGWTLEALATPGHTSNHLCLALRESGALFTGDHVMGWSTSVIAPPDGDMAAYMASLDLLMAREDAVYYPAHGPAVAEPRKLVRGLILHRRQREAQIIERLKAGEGEIAAIVGKLYTHIDPQLYPAAGRSVLAHLVDLEARGVVREQAGTWSLAA